MINNRSQIAWELFNQKDRLSINDPVYKQWVFRYTFLELEKDLNENGDITTDGLIHEGKDGTARIYANQPGIIAGIEEVEYFVSTSDPLFRPRLNPLKITKKIKDGSKFDKDDVLLEFKGDVRDILKAERTILNILQHMSGICSKASMIINKAKEVNKDICIVPTRKTTWGWLDKKAIVLAGGGTHRLNLSDAVLIKDNHLAIFGNDIKKVLFTYHPPTTPYKFFEIEIDNKDKVMETAKILEEMQKNSALPDPAVIMFDNLSPKTIEKLIGNFKKEKLYDNFIFEASGGVTEKNIKDYAKSEVDVVSLGSLTQAIKPIDLSLEIGTG